MVIDQGTYNTITNPIPNYNKNPYLNKVVNRAQMVAGGGSALADIRKSNVLSSAAASQFLL